MSYSFCAVIFTCACKYPSFIARYVHISDLDEFIRFNPTSFKSMVFNFLNFNFAVSKNTFNEA